MNRLSHFWKQYLYDPGRSVESVGVNVGLLVLRVTFGFSLLFVHGFGKLTSFGAEATTFDNPIGLGPVLSMALATFAEFFCSLAVLLGLASRLATIPLWQQAKIMEKPLRIVEGKIILPFLGTSKIFAS